MAYTNTAGVKFRNWPSMVSELERRTRFTLKRKDYVGTVAKIHENNTLLSRLVEHSTSFEPTRRANSQANAAKTIRNLTHGLFSSICNVLSCQCAGSHGVGLRLPPRVGARQVLDDDGQPLDSATSFDIIFSTNMPRKARYDYEEVPDSSTWEGLHFRWKDLVKGSSTSLSSSVDSLSTEESKRAAGREGASSLGVSLTLRERFARLRRSSSPQASTPELRPKVRFAAAGTTPGPAQSPTLSLITELCLKFQQKNGISKQPVGFVPCDRAPKGFNIYHHDHIPASSHTATLTLRQALSREQRLPMEFELVERLKIALALSSGILQICSTPWLGTIITLDNIVFIREGGAPSHYFKGDFDYPNPFLVHSTPVAAKPEKKPRPINFALLSLGILLTHIALGYPVEAIEFWENMTKQKLVSRSKLAYEKVATCDDASDNYIEAVNWCFQHCFNFATLEDADLTRSFHDAVITRLERDLSSINMLEITA